MWEIYIIRLGETNFSDELEQIEQEGEHPEEIIYKKV